MQLSIADGAAFFYAHVLGSASSIISISSASAGVGMSPVGKVQNSVSELCIPFRLDMGRGFKQWNCLLE